MNRNRHKNTFWKLALQTGLIGLLLLGLVAPGVAKKTQTIKAGEIREKAIQFLNGTLAWRPDQMELFVTYKNGDMVLPAGTIHFDFQLPGRKNRVGKVPFTLLVKVDGTIRKRARLDAEVTVIYDVIQTTQHLSRGHIISEEDIESVRIKSNRLMRNVLTDPKQIIGNKIVRNLSPGTTLTTYMVKRAHVVKRGDKIILIAEKGPLRITAPGMVKENGFKNAIVQVMNLQTKKMVYGIVVDNRTVKVEF